jgi:glycosyltransferase involved in cell wall biosynthesis
MCHNVESRNFRDLLQAARHRLARVPASTRLKTPMFRLWQSDGAIRNADHVLCLSSLDQRYITGELGVPTDRVTRLTNAPSVIPADAPPVRALHSALFVGGWLDVKGRRTLPILWERVVAEHPEARLTIVGAGCPEAEVLRDFPAAVRETVTVKPIITDPDDMQLQYREHDLFLMPSLSEGSPLSLLDAMAAGRVVVASSVGGIPDVVRHGVDGLLYESLDPELGAAAVIRLIHDPALGRRLAASAAQRARAFDWASAAGALCDAAYRIVGPDRAAG